MRFAGIVVLLAVACSAQEPAQTAIVPAATTTAATTTTATVAATVTTTTAVLAENLPIGEIFGLEPEAGACAALLAADFMTALSSQTATGIVAWPNASLTCEPDDFLEALAAPQFGITEESDYLPSLAMACLERTGPACELVDDSGRCTGHFLAASLKIAEELEIIGKTWEEGFQAGTENTKIAAQRYGEAFTACGNTELWDQTVTEMLGDITDYIPEGGENFAPTAANLCQLIKPVPAECQTV